MLHIFEVTFPFFGLVLCGYAATRARWLPLESILGLNAFVLFFALPCMLFRFGAATPIARMLDPGLIGLWLVCAMLMVGFAVATTRRGRIDWNDAAFGALVATFPNSGFMGVPLLVRLLGESAAAPAIVALAADMVITSSVCIALSRRGSGPAQGEGPERAVRQALKGMATNPLPWSIVLGCAVSAGDLALPAMLVKPVGMLADAASPVALFTLGAMLARSRLLQGAGVPSAAQMPKSDHSDVGQIVTYKLLLHPLLMWGCGHAAIALGVPLDGAALTVLVLTAALPSASNVPMLAERFGADGGRIARIVLFTTAFAFLSFSVAVALMT